LGQKGVSWSAPIPRPPELPAGPVRANAHSGKFPAEAPRPPPPPTSVQLSGSAPCRGLHLGNGRPLPPWLRGAAASCRNLFLVHRSSASDPQASAASCAVRAECRWAARAAPQAADTPVDPAGCPVSRRSPRAPKPNKTVPSTKALVLVGAGPLRLTTVVNPSAHRAVRSGRGARPGPGR